MRPTCSTRMPAVRGLIFGLLLLSLLIPSGSVGRVSAEGISRPGPVELIKDIQQNARLTVQTDFVQLGQYMYFGASDDLHGAELWRCDLTGEQLELFYEFAPGYDSGYPNELTAETDAESTAVRLYFSAVTPQTGRELWVTDGTQAGTRMLKDFIPGSEGQGSLGQRMNITQITLLDGEGSPVTRMYFAAKTPDAGLELWRTDGTPAGTELVRDLVTGPADSFPRGMTVFENLIYFSAQARDAVGQSLGYELWNSDGTAAGTVLAADVNPGSGSGIPENFTLLPVGTGPRPPMALVFTAIGATTGKELYTLDGEGKPVQVKDIYPGYSSSNPYDLTLMDNGTQYAVYFTATDGPGSRGIWVYDGTEARKLDGLSLPAGSISPQLLGVMTLSGKVDREYLFFSAPDGTLWKTDGLTAAAVGDVRLGTDTSGFMFFTVAKQDLAYFAGDDGVHGSELWSTDGTNAGTVMLADLLPGSGSGHPRHLQVVKGDRLFLSSEVVFYDNLPWIYSPSGGAHPLAANLPYNTSSDPANFVQLGDRFVFSAETGTEGSEPWVTDGTPGGTMLLRNIMTGPASSRPGEMVRLHDRVVFTAYDVADGAELWITDGTPAGTQLLKDLAEGMPSASPHSLTVVPGMPGGVGLDQELVFFVTPIDALHDALWVTDGTASGTTRITGGSDTLLRVKELAAGDGRLFFSGSDVIYNQPAPYAPVPANYELWTSDGTGAGTRQVKDIRPGEAGGQAYSGEPYNLFFWNGALYFSADDGSAGRDLWRSDGSEAGTTLIKDIDGLWSSNPMGFAPLGDILLFSAESEAEGQELWRTDGTTAGTVLVKDIYPGSDSSSPSELAAAGGWVYFSASDADHGNELWKTDGTAAGTMLVMDILPGPDDGGPYNLSAEGGLVAFSACLAEAGCELWLTSGSEATTRMVADVNPGAEDSWAYPVGWLGRQLVLTADDGAHGYELFGVAFPYELFLPKLERKQ